MKIKFMKKTNRIHKLLMVLSLMIGATSCGHRKPPRIVDPNASKGIDSNQTTQPQQTQSPEVPKRQPNPNLTPLPKTTQKPTTGLERSDLIIEKIKESLTQKNSLLSNVVRMKIKKSNQLSRATAENFLRPLLSQEKEMDFGPFVIDSNQLKRNLDTLNGSQNELNSQVQECLKWIENAMHSLREEDPVTLKADLLRMSQISDALKTLI